MDEAFVPLHAVVDELSPIHVDYVDHDAGFRTYPTAYEIEAPLELDVTVGVDGRVIVGATAPLYSVRTSFPPSFHAVRFRVEGEPRGDS